MNEPTQYRGGYEFAGLAELARELRAKQTPAENTLMATSEEKAIARFQIQATAPVR